MTHVLGDIPDFGRGRNRRAVLEKRKTRWCATATKTARDPELRRTIATPRPLAGWQCDVLSALPTRHGTERSESNAANATTPDTAPRSARRGRGARGETIMRATLPWPQSNRQDPDPALALLAGVVIVAIKDAQRGCNEASDWLSDQGIPETVWRKSRARLVQR